MNVGGNCYATLKDVGLPKMTVTCNHLQWAYPSDGMLVLDLAIKMYTGDSERDGDMLDPLKSNNKNNNIRAGAGSIVSC